MIKIWVNWTSGGQKNKWHVYNLSTADEKQLKAMFLRGKIYPSTGAMNLVLGIWNVKIGGIVIREKYHQIFILHLTPSEKCLIVSSFIFQHGSDPKHCQCSTSITWVEKCTAEHHQSWIDLPRELDLSIIEALWDHSDRTEQMAGICFSFIFALDYLLHLHLCKCLP